MCLQMAAEADIIDETADVPLLLYHLRAVRAGEDSNVLIAMQCERPIWNAQAAEDFVIESAFAHQHCLYAREEHPRFRALNDAVIVSRSDFHHLADAKLAQSLGVHRLVGGRVVNSTCRNDCPLPG